MQIKQFEGTSMEEILARVKKTLGDDAVILSTRKQSKKKMGAFTAAVYEVSAAVDVPPAPHKGIRTRGRVLDTVVAVGATAATGYSRYNPQPVEAPRPPIAVVGDEAVAPAPAQPAAPAHRAAPAAEAAPAFVPAFAPAAAQAASATPAPTPFEAFLSIEKELAPLKEEIASLKGFLELVVKERAAAVPAAGDDRLDRLADEIRSLKRQLTAAPAEAAAPAALPAPLPASPPELPAAGSDDDWLVRRLVAQGLSEPSGRRIRDAARSRCAAAGLVTDADLRREAGEYLASLVRVAELPAARENGPRILAFVGPAGAGKTATVARVGRMLASRGLRCAAVAVGDPEKGPGLLLRELQLPHGIPVLCARGADDLSRAVAVCYGAQYLLIDVEGDACGREAASRMTELFRGHAGIDFCLTLPADWDAAPADRLVASLSPLPVNYLAFTGIDRSKRNGNMVKAAAVASRPVLFLTADRGPGAVFPARPYMFSRLLLDDTATETRMSR
jgi:flagellar biosynthesis protein FlhF